MTVIPIDGRLPSQNTLSGPLTGGEVMYIVSPGNNAQGQSYQITTNVLALFFASFPTLAPTFIKSGSVYASVPTDTRILVDLTVPGVLGITMLPSAQYIQPILIKDIAGNLTNVDTATITFSGGQTADGQASIILSNAYAGIWLNPLANGFYLTNA